MARFFKGAGVGTYWHLNDARIFGFTPAAGGMPAGISTIKSHIVNQTVDRSPYISLNRSYEIAENFAKVGRKGASTTGPGYVYVVEISDDSLLIDPVLEISGQLGIPLASSYHHDGGPDVILGLADTPNWGHVLKRPIRTQGTPPGRGPKITDDLHALVRALRDAEVLAVKPIPRNCVWDRIDVI